ncbi:hypothetical protein ASC61_00660 [Aeromicrobium sp. Root344]|nr:hypothetical protein ASC61_00660 [Aeromicrobium sp. Root344]
MTEESWHQSRLIPTSGIGGAEEQERRATSALLAVMSIVPEFSKALLTPLGAPVRAVDTYVEVPFDLDGKKVIPDGLIRVRRGSKEWTGLVEVKTGKNLLQTQQLENYLDVARLNGFDALISISNEIPPMPGQHPTPVDKRKLKKVALHHWSWSYVLATAIVQKEHRGIADPEQAWILGELIRYLEHDRSGALELEDMGPNWVTVREAVSSGTLRPNDKLAPEVVARFDALLQYAGLRLGRRLGTDVTPVLSRQEIAAPHLRVNAQMASLVQSGELFGAIRIPHAVAPITITADLRANQVKCSVEIGAPQDGRATTRVNWLIRQLKDARPDVLVESFVARARSGNAALLKDVREDPKLLAPDSTKDIRTFQIALSMPLGSKRGGGSGSFIDSVLKTLELFYGDVVEHLKPWAATPPKLRDTDVKDVRPPELATTALSSQDGPEDG